MGKVRVRAEDFKAEKKAENKLQSKDIQEDTCPPSSAPPAKYSAPSYKGTELIYLQVNLWKKNEAQNYLCSTRLSVG